jgi:hypothetical protein
VPLRLSIIKAMQRWQRKVTRQLVAGLMRNMHNRALLWFRTAAIRRRHAHAVKISLHMLYRAVSRRIISSPLVRQPSKCPLPAARCCCCCTHTTQQQDNTSGRPSDQLRVTVLPAAGGHFQMQSCTGTAQVQWNFPMCLASLATNVLQPMNSYIPVHSIQQAQSPVVHTVTVDQPARHHRARNAPPVRPAAADSGNT